MQGSTRAEGKDETEAKHGKHFSLRPYVCSKCRSLVAQACNHSLQEAGGLTVQGLLGFPSTRLSEQRKKTLSWGGGTFFKGQVLIFEMMAPELRMDLDL